jgi:hypothetical protein
MAAKKAGNEKVRRVFCAVGPYQITYLPAPTTTRDVQTGRDMRVSPRIPGSKMEFRPVTCDLIRDLRLIVDPKFKKFDFILIVEANDEYYTEKVKMIESSVFYAQGRVWDADALRRQTFEKEKGTKEAERLMAIPLYARLFHNKDEARAEAEVEREGYLVQEIKTKCQDELDRRKKQKEVGAEVREPVPA